ncbi:RNA polymerase II subunit A C-terminal domain phosphatase SSU72 isoform X3 [Globicephala melas]|uniref:RNA polymerase II subunit A C-terminal domain phosphatase SSU72 isoform X3 n=1 Tax=Globicephala melas TaxID=9731 RepID=UPI00293D875A|nr:RNA polymerase II subunit A C-terminal domain phosphatase SSU72 isoform X3 [Globicephala melas]
MAHGPSRSAACGIFPDRGTNLCSLHRQADSQPLRHQGSPGCFLDCKRGFSVRSFGTGTHVKLPGPAPDKPNVYDFKTTYDQMYNDLLRKDKELYTQNGILHMLDRNKRIKPRPERFQNCKDLFDLILTCEERVYDQVVEDLNSREQETCQPVHVINVDIQDNHEEATLGAFLICELCQCIQHTEDMENEIDELLQEFEEKSGRTFLHTVCFY